MRLLIVGNGVAGITTARYVAERDPAAQITVYSDEPHPYYARPKLIDLLAGEVRDQEMPFYADPWYAERRIQVVLGCRVARVDPSAHQVTLADGASVAYDALVLAMGARCTMPPIPGRELDGVYTLRTLDDARALRQRAAGCGQAVAIGGGLLGLDTAGALRALGLRVLVTEALPWLLPRQLDAEGAAVLQRSLAARGIEVLTGSSCTQIVGAGRAERVQLKGGRAVETDLVVVSAGITPNSELARQAGLACNRGVLVDDRVQTSAPDIYAVGDVAEFNGRVWGIIPAALAQARVAAAQIVGDSATRYQDIVPSTTLKVTGIDLASIGEVTPKEGGFREFRWAEAEAGLYRKLVTRDGHAVGAIALGDKAEARLAAQLVERHTDLAARLAALPQGAWSFKALRG